LETNKYKYTLTKSYMWEAATPGERERGPI